MTSSRGTTNKNVRGSSHARRIRRAWLMQTYASDVPGYSRCYRCGVLLYNPDDKPFLKIDQDYLANVLPGPSFRIRMLTIDRIIPGCQGGTYRRSNIRPACSPCNSETGGSTRGRK